MTDYGPTDYILFTVLCIVLAVFVYLAVCVAPKHTIRYAEKLREPEFEDDLTYSADDPIPYTLPEGDNRG